MARNIVKDYIDFNQKHLREYIDIITEKNLNSKICDMIVDTYINVRYYNSYEQVKTNTIDNFEYYAIENFKKDFSDKNKEINIPLVVNALIIIRYVILYEKYHNEEKEIKKLSGYEEKLKDKFSDTKILVSGLIKSIKDNTHKKEKFLNNLLSNDFNIVKHKTNLKEVYDLYFDNSVKIPDLYSQIAIDRVYNSGIINEDKMLVFYYLTNREILLDMENFQYNINYLVPFPDSLMEKNNKLVNLLKIIDNDYFKERVILKVLYSDYLNKKEAYDKLIHEGYSLAIIIDEDIQGDVILLSVFSYILIDDQKYEKQLERFSNVVMI